MSERYSWRLVEPGRPLQRFAGAVRQPVAGEALVEVAGCGLCHTDLGFMDGSVQPRATLPLVLGHEISGRVVEAGAGAEEWVGRDVLVAAVIACGKCDMCAAGRGNVCRSQQMPGNDFDGGFATHVTVPANGLFAIDDVPAGSDVADLAVIADAVTTPLQAVTRANVAEGDLVVVVGTGGVGTYAVQVAAASGGQVIAVDIDDTRLELMTAFGAVATVNSSGVETKEVRERVRDLARSLGSDTTGWKIFECSGTPGGQETAYGLLGPAATLAIVGFTREKISLRLSNLMAFDASAFGSWGCPPELYPAAIALVASGAVQLAPFTRKVPLAELTSLLSAAPAHRDPRRPILVP